MAATVSPTAAPAAPPGRPRTWIPLLGVSFGYFTVLMDTTVLAVAEPDIARSLGGSVAGLQWTVTGYTVAFGGLLLSAGAVADRFGAHRVFRAGMAVFGLASLLSALAPGLWTLVALRGLLGVASAACVPASMVMITMLYPEPAARARAVAAWAATSGAAMAAGPIVGGLLVGLAGWRAVFLVNVPLALLTLGLTAGRRVHCPRGARPINWTGQLAACTVLGLLTDALIALGSGHTVHAAGSGAGLVAAALCFAALERRGDNPVLAPAVLRARAMRPALLAGAAVNFTLSSLLFVLPLVFRQTQHLSPLRTGLAFLPMTIPTAFNPLLTGRIVARTGPWRPVVAGLGLLAGAGLLFGVALPAGWGYRALSAGLLCAGFGVSYALPALTAAVITTAPEGAAGAAGGLLNSVRQVGASVGVAAMGAFVDVGAAGPGDGAGYALLLCAGVCTAAGIAVAARR
ncbi:MFS transporter [Kitasatospora sp. NBC_00315]|uniref:MFS transporter n=1 Tax=Kitasatospora sp. NBC_00315 TaxID=2975963 RepID=UPI003251B9C2